MLLRKILFKKIPRIAELSDQLQNYPTCSKTKLDLSYIGINFDILKAVPESFFISLCCPLR